MRDFRAAYDITKDPVLFYKIGNAYEKAGNCPDAVTYYKRYLSEATPAESFATLTRERIDACKRSAQAPSAAGASAGPGTPNGAAPTSPPNGTGATPETSASPPMPAPAGAPAPIEAATPLTQPSASKDRAWLFVGGSLTFVTVGAVLAYSTSSAEQDVRDLYISNDGRPPKFEGKTRERYDDLVAEGRRYEVLAWTSFGLAAACAVGATIFFLRDRGDVEVAPVVTPKETGVAATIRF